MKFFDDGDKYKKKGPSPFFICEKKKKTKNLRGEKENERSRKRWREEGDVEKKDSGGRRRKILCKKFVLI